MNVALLIVGLGLGQGSIFVVQTVLLATGEYELVTVFGTHYSFAMLGIIVVDGGATTILARAVARLSGDPGSRDEVWRIFCETCAIRLLTASLVGAGAAVYALGFAPDDRFSLCYVAFALPGLLLWAGNAVGVLDGLRLSGISGITGAAAYVLTAIGLALAAHRSPEAAGSILGGTFSLGYSVTLGGQWLALRGNGWQPRFHRVTQAGLVRSLNDGVASLFQLLPGQINMRVQLVLSVTYLGVETTALFIYAKQLVTAATQIIAFVLRVDFPGLVNKMSAAGRHGFRSVLESQKTTFYCALTFAVGATVVAGVAAMLPEAGLHRAAAIMASFAPTIFTLSLSLMMNQALAARGAYAAVARAVATSSALGMLVSYLSIAAWQVYAFIAGEVAIHLVGFLIAYRDLRRVG